VATSPLDGVFIVAIRPTGIQRLWQDRCACRIDYAGGDSGSNSRFWNDPLAGFKHNGDEVPADLPPLLRQFFVDTARLPEWADVAAIDRGDQLWGRYASHMGAILFCYSLPVCYGWAKGAQVLYRTTRLHAQATRRVMETCQMLQDVNAAGGLLTPDGYGLRSTRPTGPRSWHRSPPRPAWPTARSATTAG
jgi:hypothetical protein